tara:strand:- start:389 stop:658 length:270 start_codon:yes stop_codon:yes gene_type:complete
MPDKSGKIYTFNQIKEKGLNKKNYRKIFSQGMTDYFMHKDSIPSSPKFPMPLIDDKSKSKKQGVEKFRGMKRGGMVKRGGRDMFSQQYD